MTSSRIARENEDESATIAGAAVEFDPAAMGLGDGFDEAQADARALREGFAVLSAGPGGGSGVFWVRRTMKRAIEAEIGECPATRSRI